MNISGIDFLSKLYGRKELVTVTKIGQPNLFGNCWCKLSNNTLRMVRSPWEGMIIEEVVHKAVVIPCENKPAYMVYARDRVPLEVTEKELHEKVFKPVIVQS